MQFYYRDLIFLLNSVSVNIVHVKMIQSYKKVTTHNPNLKDKELNIQSINILKALIEIKRINPKLLIR